MFEDTREENVGNFPIFNFGGTHESAERKKKTTTKKNSVVLVVFETNNVLFMQERVNFASEQVPDG